MKKYILLNVFLVVMHIVSYAQIAFYDATNITNNYSVGNDTSFTFKKDPLSSSGLSAILRNYLPENTWDLKLTESQVLSYFQDNPFFGDQIRLLIGGGARAEYSKTISTAFSSAGRLNVTNFAEGLARFLIERSKEELNVAFFQKFQLFLTSYPEVKVVFPNTCGFLNEIHTYQYSSMLPALRVAFQNDFNTFPSNFIRLRNLTSKDCPDEACKIRIDTLNYYLNKNPRGRSIIGSLIVADNILNGNNAALILDNLANDPVFTDYPDENISNIMQFTNLISSSIRSKEDGKIWISKREVSDLISDNIAFRIFLGLVYEIDQNHTSSKHHIQFTIGNKIKSLQEVLAEIGGNWDKTNKLKTDFSNNFKQTAIAACRISESTQSINSTDKLDPEGSILLYANYAGSISNFLKLAFEFFPNIYPVDNLKKDVEVFNTVIDEVTASCYDIKSQNYGSLVIHTSVILENILGQNYRFKDNYIKFGTFMANITEAKNSDEVKAALESSVLPVGSSSIKRETGFNVALNAYIGPYGGGEFLPALDKKRWAYTAGLTAPVGIAVSWGNICNGKRDNPSYTRKNKKGLPAGGKSFTLFIPIIDIGSIASFRLANDSSKIASEISLKNIISPGLYLYYGFGKAPVSIGLGAQMGPQLRTVSIKDINIDKNYYFRFGFNLVVDIPLFNLYTKN